MKHLDARMAKDQGVHEAKNIHTDTAPQRVSDRIYSVSSAGCESLQRHAIFMAPKTAREQLSAQAQLP